ncbi:hypothetical protein SK128_001446 [Halocaridina rubra]|uniref:Uncharacterized protein n=1 Tax=Halocaridina rubra TaxID=373956 RepID=A0AAN8X8B2_HALRR
MDYIKDETSCCVVNIKSINSRLQSMDTQEREYVHGVSAQFLTHLVRIAHCREANKIKDAAYSMIGLFLNNIFDNFSRTCQLRSFIPASANKGKSSPENAAKTLVTQMMGSLDPATIISTILGASSLEDGSDDMSDGNHLNIAVNGMLSVLENFNPMKIDDIVMLEMCNNGTGCNTCQGLRQSISEEQLQQAMLYFFKCQNHNRFNFGGDAHSGQASRAFMNYAKDPSAIVVPLRSLLLGSLDDKLTVFGDNIEYSDNDEEWIRTLRHRPQSGDSIKQFLYTIFARFIYSATEILFCRDENSTVEFDNRNFLNYVEAITNASVLGSTLNTVKAYRSWAVNGASVAPVLDILSSGWKQNYKTLEDLDNLGVSLVNKINEMAVTSRFIKMNNNNNHKEDFSSSGLDSIRSVRQVEKYIPFGLIETLGKTSAQISKLGVSPQAKRNSNGRNFNCNSLHILPSIKGCEALGPKAGLAHQSAFEKVINPGDTERGTGKILDLITGFIDKTGLRNPFPETSQQVKERNREFIKEVIFSRTLINEDLASRGCDLPASSLWSNTSLHGCDTRCFDTRIHSLLLVWQKPNIEKPNLSALTTVQLELLLSKNNKWDKFISRNFFNIERISFQTANAIIKNMHNDGATREGSLGDESRVGVLDMILPPHLQNAQNAQRLIDTSINQVQRDWAFALATPYPSFDNIGAKAQFTDELFDKLFEIIVDHDMKPSHLIACSEFLGNYINDMDELLMKMYTC